MSDTVSVRTLISPGRYVQGRGALARLGEFLAPLGKTPLVVADDRVRGIVGDELEASLAAAGLPVVWDRFGGVPTAREIDRIVEVIRSGHADVVVGVGGGSTFDTAKAAAHLAEVRVACVPTVASTDASTSALSVVYTEDGAFEEYRLFPRNPDLVLVDTQVVANAPASTLADGVGDTLATWLEARATARAHATTMAGGLSTVASAALAKASWDTLWEFALPALDAVRVHAVTPAVEKVVEANTLLSGLGFESGGLAAAHAIHNGLTAVPQTHGLAHGQKVNLGSVTQLVLEGAPTEEIRDFVEFTTRVGLPNSLTEVGLAADDDEELRRVAEAATAPGETIHNEPFPVGPDDVVAALKAVEDFSRRVRADAGLPAPARYEAH